ncbi:MAG TPA: prepilin-type N-terminal cleavage/methylation domain-containing protein [Usitatibacter sp.]|nr:prepilin-type N-terminal cleavage/methylation domain-containing protein [Usitatibacter sp.]
MLIPSNRHSGFSMIEVLVAVVIVILGLLGLAGLHARAGMVEAESFQRAQAMELLQDMVDRISSNRKNSMSYVTASPLGTGNTEGACAGLTGANLDLCEWNNALLGAAESNNGISVGAMIGARGCVENIDPVMPRQFLVSVVWQGTVATKEPGTTCGEGLYGGSGLRRAVTATVVIGCLQNDPATGACVTP